MRISFSGLKSRDLESGTGAHDFAESISALNYLKLRLLNTQGLDQKLKLIADGVVQIFAADFARLWMIRDGDLCEKGCPHAAVTEGPDACRDHSRCLHLMASSGRYSHIDGGHRRVPLGAYKIGRVASGDDHGFITNDVTNDPRVHDPQWAAALGLVSFAGYRLVAEDGAPTGVLAFFRRSEVLPAEEGLLEDLASTASHVLLAGLAEETLRESEERYRQLVDSLPVAVAVHVKGKIVFMNPEALHALGASSLEEVIGRSIIDSVHPDCRAMAMQRVADAYERKVNAPLAQERFLRLNGEVFDVEVLLRPVTFEHQPAGQVVFWDITERKRAEKMLRESEERYRHLMDGLPDGVIVGSENQVVFANAAALRLLGVAKPEQLIGRSPALLVHPDDRATAHERARQVIETGEPAQLNVERFLREDGTSITVETVGLPFQHLGRPAVQLVFRDITERLRLEEQLQQSEKLTALGQLAGGVAHDFNNQLAGILGYAELLRERLTDNDVLRCYSEKIVTGAQRSASLIQQLLAFARKGKYQIVPVDLQNIVDDVLAILSHSLDKRIVIQCSLAEGPIRVVGDPAQIQNALLNISINARDAMPEGGELRLVTEVVKIGQTTLTTDTQDLESGTYGYVRISDTGIGMDEETLRRACEPFFTTKEPGHGTGLGLSAAYGIVRNHHGALRLTSNLGQGTTVEVFLPLTFAMADTASNAPSTTQTSNLRILLVDDEDLARSSAADLLKSLGHTVTECCDGREAAEAFAASATIYDLVILDMIMPVLSGADTLTRMRSINPHVRAILCSGYSLDTEAQRLMGQANLTLLQKPFTKSELAEAIARALTT